MMEPISQILQINQQDGSIKEDGPTTHPESTAMSLSSKIFLLLFYIHLILVSILLAYLTIRGIISATRPHLLHWYLPLLTSSTLAAPISFVCHVAARKTPSKTLKTVFWLSPLLTCAMGVLFLAVGTASSFGVAAFFLVFALVQSLYGCWVRPRFGYSTRILSVSVSAPTPNATRSLAISVFVSMTYSFLAISGLGGVVLAKTRFDPLFIALILMSLSWTMHVIRNVLHVSVSIPAHAHFSRALDGDTRVPLHTTVKHSLGSVCIGSTLVPVIGAFRGFARVMVLMAGDRDEFMFSCVSCYANVADRVVAYGNGWGFVQVGVYKKGFVRASVDTWEMFELGGMKPVIDSDLSGVLCLLSGVGGGSVCGVVGGSWALAVEKDFATRASIYAFLIGYFMVRIGMAWTQACVSAYYVAFAEDPEKILQFDSTIANRIQELHRFPVQP